MIGMANDRRHLRSMSSYYTIAAKPLRVCWENLLVKVQRDNGKSAIWIAHEDLSFASWLIATQNIGNRVELKVKALS